MKPGIFITLMALVLSACASKEHVSRSPSYQDKQEEFTLLDAQASRLR